MAHEILATVQAVQSGTGSLEPGNQPAACTECRGLEINLLALILWQLHEQLGFGKNRLMQFYNGFKPAIDELQQYYDLYTGEDTDYMCKQKLKNLGIDVEQLPEVLPMEYEVK